EKLEEFMIHSFRIGQDRLMHRSLCYASKNDVCPYARSFAVRLLLQRLPCSLSNEVSYLLRLLQHGDVASWESNRLSPGLFCTCPFHRGRKRVVFRGDHMPRWLRLPRGMRQFFVEHRTVNLTLDGKYQSTLRHRKSL